MVNFFTPKSGAVICRIEVTINVAPQVQISLYINDLGRCEEADKKDTP